MARYFLDKPEPLSPEQLEMCKSIRIRVTGYLEQDMLETYKKYPEFIGKFNDNGNYYNQAKGYMQALVDMGLIDEVQAAWVADEWEEEVRETFARPKEEYDA